MTYRSGKTSPGQKLGLIANMIRDGQLTWRLLNDRRVAALAKVMIPVLVVLYVVSPVDLIPDVIPVVGQLDDLAVLALALRLFINLAPPSVVAEHRAQMAAGGTQSSTATNRATRGDRAGNDEVVDAEYKVIR